MPNMNRGTSFSLLTASMAVGTVIITTLVLFFTAYQMAGNAIENEALHTVGAYAEGAHRALVSRLSSLHGRAQMVIANAWNQCQDEPKGNIDPCLHRVLGQFMELQKAEALFLEFGNGVQIRMGKESGSLRFIPTMPKSQLASFSRTDAPKGFFTMQAENREVPGKIVLLIKTAELDPVFANLSYVGNSGEAFLADRDGYFVTPPKYHVAEGISHPIDALPMQTCLSPKDGEMTAPDYRDVKVIHGFRYVPEVGGGCIMVHIDHNEALAGLSQFTFRWFNVAAVLLVIFGIAAYFTSRRLAEYLLGPLNHLSKQIKKAAGGEMPMPAAAGGPRELMVLTENLQKYAERMEIVHKKLAEQEKTTQSALESRTKIISDMSHELKTPLTAILALSRVMGDHDLTEEESKFVKMIHTAGGQLLALINNSLDMAKLEVGKLKVERVELDIAASIHEVLSLLGFIAEVKGYQIQLYLSMPEEHIQGPRFYGDPLRLRQILTNLIGNAIKFTSKGGVSLKVFELARETGPHTRLFRFEVTDTGLGMTPDQLENIFKRFGQADETVSANHGGSGLGLVISKELVELMGGTMGVESEAGVGSTFWFELPLEEKEMQPI